MSSKPTNRGPKASTALFLKSMFQSLGARMDDDNMEDGAPSVFEALEPRLLLSANPLSELEARLNTSGAGALLNDDASAIL